jgi:autotransporter translocation and assembly factor TamB
MFKKKWTIAILIILIVLVDIISLFIGGGYLSRHYKNKAAEELSKLLGRKVSVETIETNFINRLTLGGIRVAQGKDFDRNDFLIIDKVSINLNVLNFIIKRSDLVSSISRIDIIKPAIFINNKNGDWNIGFPASLGTQGSSFNGQVYIYHGQVIIEDVSGKFDKLKLIDLNGLLDLSSPEKQQLELTTRTNLGANDEISLKGNLAGDIFNADLSVSGADLVNYTKYLSIFKNYKFTGGLADLTVSLTGNIKYPANAIYQGKAVIKGAVIQVTGVKEDLSEVNGELTVSNRMISSPGILAKLGKYPFKVNGDILNFETSNPGFNLSIDFPATDCGLLMDLADAITGMGKIDIAGNGSLKCEVTGTLAKPIVGGEIKIVNGRVLNEQVSNLDTAFQYRERLLNLFNLATGFYKGKLVASGLVDFNPAVTTLNFDLRCDKVDLPGYLKLGNKGKDFKGQISLAGKMTGDVKWPHLEGDATFLGLSLRNYKIPVLNGKLKYYKDELSVTAATGDLKYNVDTLVDIKDTAVLVKNFMLGWDKSKITTSGKIDLKNENVYLDIMTAGLKAEDFSVIEKYYKKISGNFSFNGQLKGKPDNLMIKGQVESNTLVIQGEKINLSADFNFNGRNLKIAALEINRSYQGTGEIIFNANDEVPYADIEILAQEGQLSLLPVILPGRWSLGNISGILSGKVKLRGPWGDLTGGGELKAAKVQIMNNYLDSLESSFSIYNDQLHITKFLIQENGGKLVGTARVGLKKQATNEFNLVLNLDNFKFEKLMLEGEIDLAGKFGYGTDSPAEAMLVTSGFRINNEPQEIKTKLLWRGKILSFAPTDYKEYYSLTGQLDFNREPKIDAVVNVKNGTLEHLLKFFNIDTLKGTGGNLKGEIKLSGLLSNPEIDSRLNITEGNFRTFRFKELKTFLVLRDKVLYLKEVKGTQAKGKFSFKGNIDFTSQSQHLNVNFDCDRLELKPVVMAFIPQLKENVAGLLSGSLAVTGPFNLPTAEGSINISDGLFDKYQVKLVTGDFSFSNNTFNIASLKAENSGRVIKISGGSNIKIISDGVFSFDFLAGIRNVDFSGLSVFGGVSLSGTMDSTASSTKITAEVVTDALWVNQHKFDKTRLKFLYTGDELSLLPVAKSKTQLLGKINFREKGTYYFDRIYLEENKRETLSLKGYLRPEEDKIKLRFSATGFDAGVIGELAGLKFPVTGKTIMDWDIWGKISNPQFTVNSEIKNGSFGQLKFDNMSLIASAKDGLFNIQKMSLSLKDKLNMAGQGQIPFAFTKELESKIKEQQFNLTIAVFDTDLSVLTNFSSQIRKASGGIEAKLQVKGTIDNPLLSGYVKMTGGKISAKEIIKEASDINLDIMMANNQVTINELSGKIGEGYVSINGQAKIEGYSFKTFDLQMATSQNVGIDLAIAGFISKGTPKISLHVYGDGNNPHIDGDIKLVNTHFTYPPQSSGNKDGTDIFETYFFKNATWNLNINAVDNTWYENSLVTANVTGGIKLTGRQENFNVSGKIESIKGDVAYLGVEFTIVKAALDFQNNAAYLEGQAESKLENDVITMIIEKSQLKDIKPKFYSQENPQMTQEKVIALLFSGQVGSNVSQEDMNKLLLAEVLKLVDTNLSSRVIRPILKQAGLDYLVDVVKVKTMVTQNSGSSATTSSPFEGSELSLGKYFTNNIYVGYTTFLKSGLENRLELKHRIELEYRIEGNKFLKMHMDDTEKFMGLENRINF